MAADENFANLTPCPFDSHSASRFKYYFIRMRIKFEYQRNVLRLGAVRMVCIQIMGRGYDQYITYIKIKFSS